MFSIHLPQFEGPFDLLLFFIERDELDIQDIPIAKITDDFLDYIHQMNALNMEVASEFIYVAATLMRIKARMLIPRPETDEQGNEVDLKEDLIRRLIEYKKIKAASEGFRELEEARFMQEKRGHIQFDLDQMQLASEPGEGLESFDLYKLLVTYRRLIEKSEERESKPQHVVELYPYNIEEQKKMIRRLLTLNQTLNFKDLAANSENKVQFVYNFLAMLEMLNQELLEIEVGLGYNDFRVRGRL